MGVYRKKPVEVEAIQFEMELTAFSKIDEFLEDCAYVDWSHLENGCIYLETLEGVMRVSEGDYIIKGVHGEFYPCKPDIFNLTYEKI